MSTLTCYTYTLSLHDALPISRVDRRAHFGELQIVSADRDFVDGSRLFALGADDLREFGGVDLGCQCGWRRRSRRRPADRKSTRLNSSHVRISYAVFCLKKKTD